jgi:hypothetical protein
MRATNEPARSNNWGVAVINPPEGGIGTRLYLLDTPGAEPVAVTVQSSQLSYAQLRIVEPYVEDPRYPYFVDDLKAHNRMD